MCGIVAFRDKSGRLTSSSGRIMLSLLEALACRGPDGTGLAMIGPEPEADSGSDGAWFIRFAGRDEPPFDRLTHLGRPLPLPVGSRRERTHSSLRARFVPNPEVTAGDLEGALGDAPRRTGNPEPRAQARPGQAGRLATRPRGGVLHFRVVGATGHRPHAIIHREPDRLEPLAAVLGTRGPRPGHRPQRPRDQLSSAPPPLRAAGSGLLHRQ